MDSEFILQRVEGFDSDIVVLYEQLKSRQFSISHRMIPSYEDHCEFVRHNPYRAWFLVLRKGVAVGNIYVQYDNSVGLNGLDALRAGELGAIIRALYDSVKPLPAISSLRFGDFIFNVAAENETLQKKLEVLHWRVKQVTFAKS